MVALPHPEAAPAAPHARFEIVTETIVVTPTATPNTGARTAHDAPLPIGAIAGGAAGGFAIALVAAVLWTWWGRCIRRKQAKTQKEIRELLAVRENTRRNAGPYLIPSSDRYTSPPRRPHKGRKIRFAGMPSASEKSPPGSENNSAESLPTPPSPFAFDEKGGPESPLPSPPLPSLASNSPPVASTSRTFLSRIPRTPWGTSVLPSGGPVIMPRPKVPRPEPIAERASSEGLDEDNARFSRTSSTMANETGGPPLRHQPSGISTESAYSTQSGEPRRARERGVLWALRQQLDINRLSAFSVGSLYSVDERQDGE